MTEQGLRYKQMKGGDKENDHFWSSLGSNISKKIKIRTFTLVRVKKKKVFMGWKSYLREFRI